MVAAGRDVALWRRWRATVDEDGHYSPRRYDAGARLARLSQRLLPPAILHDHLLGRSVIADAACAQATAANSLRSRRPFHSL
jgi:hypothetical protein